MRGEFDSRGKEGARARRVPPPRSPSASSVCVAIFMAAGIGCSSIWDGARSGDLDAVRRHLKADPALVNRCESGDKPYTPVELAAKGGHLEVLKFLVEHGGDVNAECGASGFRALDGAVGGRPSVGKDAVISWLLSEGASARSEIDLLCSYTGTDSSVMALLLRAAGGDPDRRCPGGGTAFLRAAMDRNRAKLEFLLSSGANPDARDDRGWHAVELARRDSGCFDPHQGMADRRCLRDAARSDPIVRFLCAKMTKPHVEWCQ